MLKNAKVNTTLRIKEKLTRHLISHPVINLNYEFKLAEESRSSKNSQPKKTANEKITTVRNYFQLSNPPNNHSRLNENEVSNIVASSAHDSVSVHNNHHTSIDNSEENINLLPIILPNTR